MPINNHNPEFSSIVQAYRSSQGLSLRDFADQLGGISYQSVKNWEDGASNANYYYLLSLALTRNGWVRDFAFNSLAALRPDLYEPVTDLPGCAGEPKGATDLPVLPILNPSPAQPGESGGEAH